jgi:hypothetical protein
VQVLAFAALGQLSYELLRRSRSAKNRSIVEERSMQIAHVRMPAVTFAHEPFANAP